MCRSKRQIRIGRGRSACPGRRFFGSFVSRSASIDDPGTIRPLKK